MDMYSWLYLRWINQLGPTIYHMELCSVLCGSLDGRGVWGVDACMAESLSYLPEIIIAFLIGYTPIQNTKFKKKFQFLLLIILWEFIILDVYLLSLSV